MIVTLPYPPSALNPNRSNGQHWSKTRRAKTAYRRHCMQEMQAQKVKRTDATTVKITLTFHPPTAHARDVDNAVAAMKSAIDGLAEMLGLDDSNFTYGEPVMSDARKPGCVIVEITK
jgi:crossover junction endodeoxyribonuclease RusA